MRYRLDVVAPSVAEVVRVAGGWLFDRVMAGWDVTVLVDGGADDRPLQILGADTGDLESALAGGLQAPRPHALAVSAELYARDTRIRKGVRDALAAGQTEVTMWGESWPEELRGSVDTVEHRLSVAARAFKVQALAAAAEPIDAIGFSEIFRTGAIACCPSAADLVPAS
ncbi:hypothetical protein [Mycolicibacterium palauense]|uniref:hypothetical protein n=1 Tax=Mycolicibacterium palauense TaxID=2034511 RepID=UPI000BFEFD43|nr:hypothetical protein [Mycolicibacterium palauense]